MGRDHEQLPIVTEARDRGSRARRYGSPLLPASHVTCAHGGSNWQERNCMLHVTGRQMRRTSRISPVAVLRLEIPATDSDFQGWIPDDDEKVRLFVLVYLLAGCDFLPAISGLPFGTMWALTLKSVRTEGVFRTYICAREGGEWGIKTDECIKLLANIFYFKYEASFTRGGQEPGWIFRTDNGDVAHYVDVIRMLILRRGSKKATSTCPCSSPCTSRASEAIKCLGTGEMAV
ncbi:unnamed protein product [Ectocarpus sp. CCAP 1310/34]|nr:unnamed protein product [Ectocarpus sp. CCAP 1310/34]